MSSSTVVTRNSEIITVLCRTTQTTEGLLDQLNTAYPEAGWTLESLSDYLSLGKRQGRFCQVRASPDTWQVRTDMVQVGPSNLVYQNLCSSITKRYACVGGYVSSPNGVDAAGTTCLLNLS